MRISPMSLLTLSLAGGALAGCHVAANEPPKPPTTPTSIDQAMLFRSFVQDDDACAVAVEGGDVVAPSPASCPDAYAWATFASAIQDSFWTWGTDQTTWPATPWPLCTDGVTESCCPADFVGAPTEDLLAHCSYDRSAVSPIPPLPVSPSSSPSGVVLSHRGAHKKTSVEDLDPGRLLRDLEVELVFRNRPMIEYIFQHDLYNAEGLGARASASNAAMAKGDIGGAHALEVRLPTDAIMLKADFIHQDIMLAQGLIQRVGGGAPPNNPDYPYLTVYLEGDDAGTTGYYYLVGMTNASKALPEWHWYAMEHVANRGRCDYIGCNDSYGYAASSTQPNGAVYGGHFVPPKQQLQNDQATTPTSNPNDAIFLTGEVYRPEETGEAITEALAALLDAAGVGTAAVDVDPKVIAPEDPQWRNYRLKGTQTTFTTSQGVPTGTGATVTEGGFVNSASCMTCHSQASTNAQGQNGAPSVGATWRPNLFGFQEVVMGAPDLNWFFNPGANAPYVAVQVDFIWGTLSATCVKDSDSDGICDSYPAAPTVLQ